MLNPAGGDKTWKLIQSGRGSAFLNTVQCTCPRTRVPVNFCFIWFESICQTRFVSRSSIPIPQSSTHSQLELSSALIKSDRIREMYPLNFSLHTKSLYWIYWNCSRINGVSPAFIESSMTALAYGWPSNQKGAKNSHIFTNSAKFRGTQEYSDQVCKSKSNQLTSAQQSNLLRPLHG